MIRELIDIALLEDFVGGLSRAADLRVCVYDSAGTLVVASHPAKEFTRLTGFLLGVLPPDMPMVRVPAHDPPGHVGYAGNNGVWIVSAPVYVDDRQVGFLGVGEFREQSLSGEQWQQAHAASGADLSELIRAWEALPVLDRSGTSHAVVSVRWGARLLAEWCRRESGLLAAADQVALVGDIAELLTGEHDLQHILDRIVRETARVVQCPFCSIRLYDARTNELTIKAVYRLSREYLRKGAVRRVPGSVDDTALSGEIVQIPDMTTDPRVQYPEHARQEGLVSMLTAGMIYRGSPVGVIRVYTNRRRRFRKAQRDLLRAVAYQAATAIVHAQLVDERLKHADTQRQLALAGDLQKRMVHHTPPQHPRLETSLVFLPSYRVGGDFGDFFTLRDGRTTAVVADVVGKGIPASLLMSYARGALRADAGWCDSPADLLNRLNQQLCRDTRPDEFITLALATIDGEARRLTYASAGHEPVLILRGGQVIEGTEGGLVAGFRADEVYEEHEIELRAGDFLLLYTDGAVEARNFADEEFGRERLHDSLRSYGELAPEQILRNIVWDVRRFVGLAEQSDDLTLVGMRVRS